MRQPFTEDEDRFVRENWSKMTNFEISARLPGRTPDAVHKYGIRIGLPKKGKVARRRTFEPKDAG